MKYPRLTRMGSLLALAVLLSACSEQSPTSPATPGSGALASSAGTGASPSLATHSGTASNGVAPQASEPRAGFEINYLKFVADHHLMGVLMAQLCVEKAVHEELREDCRPGESATGDRTDPGSASAVLRNRVRT